MSARAAYKSSPLLGLEWLTLGQIWLKQSLVLQTGSAFGTSGLTGSEPGILLVQQEVSFGHFRSDRKYSGVLQGKPEVFVGSTGCASGHFLSMAHGLIKAWPVPQRDLYPVTSGP